MSEIAFHFNVPDRGAYACRLLRKVCGLGHKVLVVGPVDELERLDVALWTFAPQEFLTHCWAHGTQLVREASSVVLAPAHVDDESHRVLLNLGEDVPTRFDRHARVIEIVGTDASDRSSARARWRQYTSSGHTLVQHDIAARATGQG